MFSLLIWKNVDFINSFRLYLTFTNTTVCSNKEDTLNAWLHLDIYPGLLYNYSVVSIKQTGGNKRIGWAEFFDLLHEKKRTGWCKKYLYHMKNECDKNFKIVKRPCSLNRYYRVSKWVSTLVSRIDNPLRLFPAKFVS